MTIWRKFIRRSPRPAPSASSWPGRKKGSIQFIQLCQKSHIVLESPLGRAGEEARKNASITELPHLLAFRQRANSQARHYEQEGHRTPLSDGGLFFDKAILPSWYCNTLFLPTDSVQAAYAFSETNYRLTAKCPITAQWGNFDYCWCCLIL